MKFDIICLLFSHVCVGVSLAYGAPIDQQSRPRNRPQPPAETAASIAPTPEELFMNLPHVPLSVIAEHLTVKESATLARAINHYRLAIKGSPQSPEFYFGSKEEYVENVKHCDWLQKNPDKKKMIKAIYVTSEVFMECQFGPKEFPNLRNVSIRLMTNDESDRPSRFYYNLLNDQGFIAIKNGEWSNGNALGLRINQEANERAIHGLEWHAIRKRYSADWLPFLLKHRDWKSMDDPFKFWEDLFFDAFWVSDKTAITNLLKYAKDKPFRQHREPFAVEEALMYGPSYYRLFRGYVDDKFLDALLAVESNSAQGVFAWLSGMPTTDQVCRVLNFYLRFREPPGMNGYNGEFVRLLANDQRLNVNYKDRRGDALILLATKQSHWEALDVLLSRGGINLTAEKESYSGLLQYAVQGGVPFGLFQKLLIMGANTFGDKKSMDSPLLIAFKKGNREFFDGIIAKRLVVNAEGVLELQLTASEKEFVDRSKEAPQWIGGHPIRIISP